MLDLILPPDDDAFQPIHFAEGCMGKIYEIGLMDKTVVWGETQCHYLFVLS
jgi:GH24 family phage-related lysozyme (muramidase)